MENKTQCIIITILVIGLFLAVILIPLSFSYVEYYEYGLEQRKTTGAVDTSQVYTRGRYPVGPDYQFIKYQADAHVAHLEELSIFSAGVTNESIGLEFKIDVDFTYMLNRDEVGAVHRELARSYRDIILSRTKDAIKNQAIFVTFREYFQARKEVEQKFRAAVEARWNANPPLHSTLDQFHLGRIQIPDSVAEKQLDVKIQLEENAREAFLQEARIERERTAVEVNAINLTKAKVIRTARAQAGLIVAKARAEAQKIVVDAETNGTLELVEAVSITTQDHLTAFSYIRSLAKRDDVTIDLNYLGPENIVKTKQV